MQKIRKMISEELKKLNEELKNKSEKYVLEYFIKKFPGQVAFSTSMGAEDQVITQMISTIDGKIKFFTLDTEKLFKETYDLIKKTEDHYQINIEILKPDPENVKKAFQGRDFVSIYEKIEYRKACCDARKIFQLPEAFKGMKVWISGIRQNQYAYRQGMQLIEWDSEYGLLKVNPLIAWSEDDVWKYIHKNHVPYNELHDNGYRSIGCEPCTRKVSPEEDIRSGRWWWELPEFRECGLHVRK